MLQIDWVYPVLKPLTGSHGANDGHTVAQMAERALPLEQAYEFIAEGDRRPLLIVRECELCKGTDHAILSRTLDNEQTVLLTHWFRCVKLPPNVLKENHPFANLFKREKDGERIPHLFFVDPDGSHKQELPGDQAQSVLWDVMFDYLDRCYQESAKQAIKEMRKLLSQYDKLDAEEQEVRTRIDKEIERHGPKSDKLKKFDGQLAKVEKERQKLRDKEKELRELALKPPPEVPAEAAPEPADDKPADAKPAVSAAGSR